MKLLFEVLAMPNFHFLCRVSVRSTEQADRESCANYGLKAREILATVGQRAS